MNLTPEFVLQHHRCNQRQPTPSFRPCHCHSERSEESRSVLCSTAQSEILLRRLTDRNNTDPGRLRHKQKDLPAFGVGLVLLSKHGRRLDFSSHPVGPQGLGLYCAFSNPGLGEHSYPSQLDEWKQHKVLCRMRKWSAGVSLRHQASPSVARKKGRSKLRGVISDVPRNRRHSREGENPLPCRNSSPVRRGRF